jgi:peptidoglycan/xylan/chitin deacetylase (PgdA/CDA1 family)
MGALNSVKKQEYFKLTPYHITGLAAILLSIIIFLINAMFAIIPLLLFAFVCAIAPFMTKLSFFLPVISHGRSGQNAVSLTFDDGPDPNVTPAVLELLAKYSVKATFFVTGQNAERYPEIIRKIISQGHSIGNHSYKHDPILMLRTRKTVFNEINICQNILQKFSITTFAFRPPAGITNPRLRKVLLDLDMYCVNWSCRALDAGNRKITGLAKKILNKVKADDIILLHDINPDKRNNINDLINEFETILIDLKKSGLNIISLSEITGKGIMKTKPK